MLRGKRRRASRHTDFFSRIKKNELLHRKIIRRIMLLLILFFVFYLYFVGDYGFFRLLSLKKEKDSLILEAKKLQAENVDLEMEKAKLKEDLFYIEKVARERYGMAKEDEVIYKFVQPENNPSTSLPQENK
jgi:cell division protein FtsB